VIRLRLRVRGEVQGVGFRPRVLRMARQRGLTGTVHNDASGVRLEIQGETSGVGDFMAALEALPPPVRVAGIGLEEIPVEEGEADFQIRASATDGESAHALPPDLAICEACRGEVRDPGDRRFDHPFASCTGCGPRATIALTPPFDRDRSAMAGFPLCAACAGEYRRPDDRRFHAQTIACPDCGPRLTDATLDEAAACLLRGGVVGLKGIGGFQLLCDATDAGAVARVRAIKRRPDKPMAVMVADVDAAEALVGALEGRARRALTGTAGPIVLAAWSGDGLAPGVAPGAGALGVMLPTTALHQRLMDRVGRPLVCTSGNPSGEPLATERRVAEADLGDGVDRWLDHDRPILRPMDDSVVKPVGDAVIVLRRARGLAPRPLRFADGPVTLAFGAHLQAAPALSAGGLVHVAPHVGDLDSRRTFERYEAALDALLERHGVEPERLICDLHPDLPSSRLARRWERERGVSLLKVQHHRAHVASVLAERRPGPLTLGVAWDGYGYGPGGEYWGGEFFAWVGGMLSRAGSLVPIPLPGGDRAAREPARVGLALLHACDQLQHPAAARIVQRAREALGGAVTAGVLEVLDRDLAPGGSSMGRLFDGVAFLLGGPARVTFEAQAARWLEALAGRGGGASLPLPLTGLELPRLDWGPLIPALLDRLQRGDPPEALARSFHAALVDGIRSMAQLVGMPNVVFAGGCFQNALLFAGARRALEEDGRRVYAPRLLPPGDGGLALGQLYMANVARRRR